MAKIYEVIAYTGKWAHRRLFFPTLTRAKRWAEEQPAEGDVTEVWLCVIDSDARRGSYGAIELDFNGPIEYYESQSK